MKIGSARACHWQISYFNGAVDAGAEIARLHLGIRRWQVVRLKNVFSDIKSSQRDLNAIEEFYVRPGGNFFVARDAATGQIIGFVGIKVNPVAGVKTGIIKRMAVVPAYHRRGVGTGLLELALGWARDNGFAKITLTTGPREHAKPLYEKFGFTVVGRVMPKGDYRMELKLREDLKKVPDFKTPEEEAAFWDTHDSAEYVDWSRAQKTVNGKFLGVFPNLKSSAKPLKK